MKTTNRPILLVEDDQVDTMTVMRALKEIHVTNPVVHLENGEEALLYLQDPASEKPCIILLDLNMPIMNGIEFLQVVKHNDQLKRIPVIVLTTSEEQQDKMSSFNLGVAGERGSLLWTGKLMLFYQLVRRIHETYLSSYFYRRI